VSRAPIDIRNLPLAGDPSIRRRAVFRYRGAARHGGTLGYVFEADEQSGANVATKEKVAEIGADVMTTFYHVNVGALETQKFRTTPLPSGFAFSDRIKGPLRQLFFAVLLPDGTVVEPSREAVVAYLGANCSGSLISRVIMQKHSQSNQESMRRETAILLG
jgi:hypothetical protein